MASKRPLHTQLNDNANIYQKRENQSEREKWNSLDTHGKIEYFKDYYLKKVLVSLIILAFVTYFIVTIATPKSDIVLSVAMVNCPLPENELTQITDDMNQLLSVDQKHEKIRLDANYSTVATDTSTVQRLLLFISTGELDILIAPQSVFQVFASQGLISPLTDLLTTDRYSSIPVNDLFSCKTLEEDEQGYLHATGPLGIYGINISNNPLFKDFNPSALQKDPLIIGVNSVSENSKNAVSFLQYILDLK